MIRFGSVCSGIEAASVAWHPLGWKAAWFSEIEPFPCAVLAHHYPDVPNLGDMTTLPARIASGEVDAPDVLCGGTPCQSWSVAGKRGGADDPRGQLTFSFLRIAEVSKPRFIVWENVPGILSVDKGRPFCQFLDGLLALGYVVNCDILDAQFFGLAQRRRRVFVVCQHASFLMKEKSNISVTIGAIAVLGILQNILAALHQESGSSPEKLAAKCANVRDGLERKIKCFSVQPEEILQTWLQNLAEAFLSAATDREYWELNLGPGTKTAANSSQSVGTQLSVFQDETASRSLCLSTSQSWKSELEDLFSTLKSFTTLTELKAITAQKICIYAEMLHTIGWFIAQSKESCPHLLKLESLHSTLTKEFTKYARQADEPFFRGERFFGFWDDFSSKARASIDLIASARNDFDPCAVLFESDSLRRDTAPSREARQVAPTIPSRGTAGGGLGTDFDCDGGVIQAFAIQAGALRTNPISSTDGTTHALGCGSSGGQASVAVAIQDVRGTDKAQNGRGWNDDGTAYTLDTHATQGVAICGAFFAGQGAKAGSIAYSTDVAPTLKASDSGTNRTPSVHINAGAVVFQPRHYSGRERMGGEPSDVCHTLSAQAGQGDSSPHVAYTTKLHNTGSNNAGKIFEEYSTCLDANSPAPAVFHTLYNQGIETGGIYASTQETHAGALLRTLREEVGEEAFAQWGLGILGSLQSPEILRQALHGLSIRPAAFSRSWVVHCALSRSENGSGWLLQSLREAGCERCASQGWEPSEQLAGELGAYLSELSRPGAQAARFLHDLWQASQGLGVLRQALSAVQEVGRPAGRQGQSILGSPSGRGEEGVENVLSSKVQCEVSRERVLHEARAAGEARYSRNGAVEQERSGKGWVGEAPFAVRRLTVEECEFLQGFPRSYTAIPWRKKPASECPDGPRYKALGNSWAVPVAAWIAQRIHRQIAT